MTSPQAVRPHCFLIVVAVGSDAAAVEPVTRETARRVIESEVFIRNVGRLARFIAASGECRLANDGGLFPWISFAFSGIHS